MKITLFSNFNVKSGGWLSMHHVIAERHGGTCANPPLSRWFACALGPRLDTKLQSSRWSHWKKRLYSYGVEVRMSTSTLLRPCLSFTVCEI
ncbi:hypothetical protein Hanom_Chr05g00464731 [Helianthus anomalus]